MKTLRTFMYALAAVALLIVMVVPALVSICMEEIAHKKGDESDLD